MEGQGRPSNLKRRDRCALSGDRELRRWWAKPQTDAPQIDVLPRPPPLWTKVGKSPLEIGRHRRDMRLLRARLRAAEELLRKAEAEPLPIGIVVIRPPLKPPSAHVERTVARVRVAEAEFRERRADDDRMDWPFPEKKRKRQPP